MRAGAALSDVDQARGLIAAAEHLVCLTGAGISAESGISTFRHGQSGLWARFNPATLASPDGFRRDPERVWQWYRSRYEAVRSAQPNRGHRSLARMQRIVPTCQVITQNVDDLHERAGATAVWHLHGDLTRCHCQTCGRPWSGVGDVWTRTQPPACACGGLFRPSVVWFGELLDAELWRHSLVAARSCDVMLVVGTSGLVAPAVELPFQARAAGAAVVDVNPEPTDISRRADLWLAGRAGEILPQLIPRQVPPSA